MAQQLGVAKRSRRPSISLKIDVVFISRSWARIQVANFHFTIHPFKASLSSGGPAELEPLFVSHDWQVTPSRFENIFKVKVQSSKTIKVGFSLVPYQRSAGVGTFWIVGSQDQEFMEQHLLLLLLLLLLDPFNSRCSTFHY
jgi:hypothetical protein